VFDLSAPTPKAVDSFDRAVTLDRTLRLLPTLRCRFGITRVADLTYLDRLGVPVFSSVVPRSPDLLTVYNGKGLTREAAVIGAVMEAVERQAAGHLTLETIATRPADLPGALDPRELGADEGRPEDEPLAFVRGYDLLREETAWVPRAAVEWPCAGPRIFPVVTTNGLAAGNTLLEAVYHGLFELVERHVWSVAHARAYLRPHALLASLAAPGPGGFDRVMVDDPIGTAIVTPTGVRAIDALLERIDRCGLTVRLLAMTEGALPTTVFATLVEPGAAAATAHIGIGASWSPVHATIRALTEAVQSRLTDVQGAREDIFRAGDDRPTRFRSHSRRIARLPHGRWHFDGPVIAHARLDALPDRAQADLGAELAQLLAALRTTGVERAIVVDITPPECPVAVVRIVAPGLESMVADGRIGRTIRAILHTAS
jgi:ribosomal protein S12 methylthiotransferase accessory factor